jgi:hypothetical protein
LFVALWYSTRPAADGPIIPGIYHPRGATHCEVLLKDLTTSRRPAAFHDDTQVRANHASTLAKVRRDAAQSLSRRNRFRRRAVPGLRASAAGDRQWMLRLIETNFAATGKLDLCD